MEIGLIIFWLVCGFASAAIANAKGRSGCAWLFIGTIGGLIAFMVIVALPPAGPVEAAPAQPAGGFPNDYSGRVACQWCLEPVRPGAKVCPHCQRDEPIQVIVTEPAEEGQPAAEAEEQPEQTAAEIVHDAKMRALWGFAGVFMIALVVIAIIVKVNQ